MILLELMKHSEFTNEVNYFDQKLGIGNRCRTLQHQKIDP